MQKITPFLWFDGKAEEAMNFYTSIFSDAKVISVSRKGAAGSELKGEVMSATFELQGQQFMVLNAEPQFKFTEAVSFFISCDTQEEVDRLWEALSEGGEKGRCGWLKDKYGLSWQVIPALLGKLLSDKDREKAGRVMKAMMAMNKIDTAVLQQAYEQ